MKRKLKILYKASKKAFKKVTHITHKNFYKGNNFPKTIIKAIQFPFKHGLKTTVFKLKREILRVSNDNVAGHRFPNGIVSGVNLGAVQEWQTKHPVSIVIPSYNDFELLRVCVDSIHATCQDSDYEIIIVDDFCVEENRKKLRTLIGEKTKVIFRKKNGGFAKAVNTGIKAANLKNDIVLLNSDIKAHTDWLKALQYGAYEFAEGVGIVGPKLLYPDGRIQSAGSHRNTESPEWFDHYYRFQQSDYGPANVPQYCLSVTGACQYIKREVIDKIGILDEGFAFAFEDVDFTLRAWQAGYKTLYFPVSTLTHFESATRAKNKTIGEKEKISVRYFWDKWGDWFDKRNVTDENGRIRIIFVLQSWGFSGGIKNVIEHANRLHGEGFATEVWSLDNNKPAWDIVVPTRSFKTFNELVKALEKQDAIKVATWWETAFPVWLGSLQKGIAVNMIQEIESWFYPNDPDAQRAVISCYRKEFKNMTISSYNLDELGQLGLSAELIPCGYDETVYQKINGIKKQSNTLLAVGRSFFQKNFPFTFDAWKLLGESRPKLLLYGSEPEMKALDKKISYVFKPSDEDVNILYNKSTAFVQTSRHEGFCLPILEAMASGTPVICTDAHGNRDFCIDGKTCLMVNHDDRRQLKEAIEKIFRDKKLRERLIKNGLKEAEKYTWPIITKRLVEFYENVANPEDTKRRILKTYGDKER